MLEEAKAMMWVAKHDHIVNFQGVSMQENKVYVLLEFCSFGSIDRFLRTHEENFRAKMECGSYKEVVKWCFQVANAMEFMVENNIIHVSKDYSFLICSIVLPNISMIFDAFFCPF